MSSEDSMTHHTAEESKKKYIAAMGEELGSQYAQLWQEVAYLHQKWAEYVELFGTKPSRIDLMNQAAPAFFRNVQDALWEGTLLHIARLTDPSESGKGKGNLSIQNFPALITDAKLREEMKQLIEKLLARSNFCRDWRNRRIAHRDLSLALDQPVEVLKNGSRKDINELLELIVEIMNLVSSHFLDSQTNFKVGVRAGGAVSLLYVIDDGVKADAARLERIKNGKATEDDFRNRDL
jgi:hypothetical protein